MRQSLIPTFFLYGEPPRSVGDRFLHLEHLDDRSRPNGWTIRPHAHANLSHILYIARGGGTMRVEARAFDLVGPCLLIVPSGAVHSFTFDPDSIGMVLTIAEAYLRDLLRREADLAPLFDAASMTSLGPEHRIETHLTRLADELVWTAPGHAAAVEALLLTLLVDTLRLRHRLAAHAREAPGRHALLVARFRKLLEDTYRSHTEIPAYCTALHVSESRLREACARVTGASAKRLLRDRTILEAKRLLLYSDMSVAEIGFYLGLKDPAYFSRFFVKSTGQSPRAFRQDRHAEPIPRDGQATEDR